MIDVKEGLRHAARALDGNDYPSAIASLAQIDPFGKRSDVEQGLLSTVWQTAITKQFYRDPEDSSKAAAHRFLMRLDFLGNRLDLSSYLTQKGFDDTPPIIMAGLLTGRYNPLLSSRKIWQTEMIIELLYNAGLHEQALAFWELQLRSLDAYRGNLWFTQSLVQSIIALGYDDPVTWFREALTRIGRADRAPAYAIFAGIVVQHPWQSIAANIANLDDTDDRREVLRLITTRPMTCSQLETARPAVDLLRKKMGGEAEADQQLFDARIALAKGENEKAQETIAALVLHPELGAEALIVAEAAELRLGDRSGARLPFLNLSPAVPWYLRSRAAALGVELKLRTETGHGFDEAPSILEPPRTGRPLVQAFWHGKSLRWIEQLSMRSFLLNGWRYHLYVYEPPDNLPEGVELRAASSILPERYLFAESQKSGAHRGSLGAFSDLFRYALIHLRGGLWSDTDVINLRAFEPEGRHFVASEETTAGFPGLNGAMIAAEPENPIIKTCLDRTQSLIARDEVVFGRVGPHLLAEVIGKAGLSGFDVMNTGFLNPVSWCETASFFDTDTPDFDQARFRDAMNIHAYTETWRLMGVDFLKPPSNSCFMGQLRHRIETAGDTRGPDTVAGLLNLPARSVEQVEMA